MYVLVCFSHIHYIRSPVRTGTGEQFIDNNYNDDIKIKSLEENFHRDEHPISASRSRSRSPLRTESEEQSVENSYNVDDITNKSLDGDLCESEIPPTQEHHSCNTSETEVSIPKKFYPGNKTYLSIENIPPNWNHIDVKICMKKIVKFSEAPSIGYISFRDSTENPGYLTCAVIFSSAKCANEALEQLDGKEVDGYKLRCKILTKDDHTNFLKNNLKVRPYQDSRIKYKYILRPLQNTNETYGLSMEFLASLGITPPLHPCVSVTNLQTFIDEAKLQEVFSLAGQVISVFLKITDDTAEGHVNYDHPLEAVQAVSMFNNKNLYNRKLHVEMNKKHKGYRIQLPSGLSKFGEGLGARGEPLRNVRVHAEIQAIKQAIQQKIGYTFSNTDNPGSKSWSTSIPKNSGSSNDLNLSSSGAATGANNLANNQILQTLLLALTQGVNSSLTAQSVTPNAPTIMPIVPNNMPNVANNMQNVPNIMQNALNTMQNVPNTMQNFPNTMQNVPNTMQNVPNTMQNVPNTMQNVPNTMQNVPITIQNVPNTMQNVSNIMPNVPNTMQNVPNIMSNVPNIIPNVPNNKQNVPNIMPNVSSTIASAANAMPNVLSQNQELWPTSQEQMNLTVSPSNSNQSHYSEPANYGKSYEQNSSSYKYNSDRRSRDESAKGSYSSRATDYPSRFENDSSKRSKMLIFKNLPHYLTIDILKTKMREVGEIKFAEYAGQGKALLQFVHSRDADTCIKLYNKSKVDGQMIDVEYKYN